MRAIYRRDQAIAELAGRQHGIVARAQLLELGIGSTAIDRRIRAGWLRPVHNGVYATGVLDAPLGRMQAAVMACGSSAVASHRSAARLWQILARERVNFIQVTVAPHVRRRRAGLRVYRSALADEDRATVAGIPTTTPNRTLYDLASILPTRELERAMAEAVALELTSLRALRTFLCARPRRPGAVRLQRLLDDDVPPPRTRSQAEEVFLGLIRSAQLPHPLFNAEVQGYEVDAHWPAARLVVEVDGFTFHASRQRFEADRRRDAVLAAAGIRVVRITWRQIQEEPVAVVARLAQALAHAPTS